MADPKELEEAAEAILRVRQLPAARRHQELDGPLHEAEEWARKHYRKVTEQPEDNNNSKINALKVRTAGKQLKLNLG